MGASMFVTGLIIGFQYAKLLIVDAYSASATGVAVFVGTIARFGFPFFGARMYEVMGLGWGNRMLGFVSVGLGVITLFGLSRYGAWLRLRSCASPYLFTCSRFLMFRNVNAKYDLNSIYEFRFLQVK